MVDWPHAAERDFGEDAGSADAAEELLVLLDGYRIDLAVRSPDGDGEYLLGIECDGATYHSAKSARDRDRLRQEVIERRGWKLHRIWSTDWFRNQSSEELRLARVIERLLAERTAH